jgi:alpha-L-fucosidase
MFIHWGLIPCPPGMSGSKPAKKPGGSLHLYIKYFNPDLYDPKDWARRAREAGMKYAVFTTKHHEVFCMFDSAYTDYKCTNTLPGET